MKNTAFIALAPDCLFWGQWFSTWHGPTWCFPMKQQATWFFSVFPVGITVTLRLTPVEDVTSSQNRDKDLSDRDNSRIATSDGAR